MKSFAVLLTLLALAAVVSGCRTRNTSPGPKTSTGLPYYPPGTPVPGSSYPAASSAVR